MSTSSVDTQVGRVVWHQLATSDVERAKRFYTDLLGWGIEVWKPGEIDYPMITVDGRTHGGFQDSEGAPTRWIGHVLVEDADAALARAEANGGAAAAPILDMPEVGRFALIRDPEGAVLSAYTPPPAGGEDGEEFAAGVFLWDELLAADVDGAKRFYSQVFGWETTDMDMGEMGTYTLFKGTGGIDAGGLMKKRDDMPAATWIPYLATDDVDATVARAGELGATVLMPGMDVPDVGRFAVLLDPTGGLFGLYRPKESD